MRFSTGVVLIGNSDNKLNQAQWSAFCVRVGVLVSGWSDSVHFSGASESMSIYQNAAWVFVIGEKWWPELRRELREVAKKFGQDSIAVVRGRTSFLKGVSK